MQYVTNQLSAAYYWIPATTFVTLWSTVHTIDPAPDASNNVKLAHKVANFAIYVFEAGVYALFMYSCQGPFFAGFLFGIFAPNEADRWFVQPVKVIYDRTSLLEKAFILLAGVWIKMPYTVPTLTIIATAALGSRMILRHEPLPSPTTTS